MSKHGTCELHLPTCVSGPLAWWQCPNGRLIQLCKPCLDMCFDSADNDPDSEPVAWGWLVPPEPPAADVAAWARDPRNHRAVATVLRREAHINPGWLREFIARDERIHCRSFLVRA